jgi:hypothetical protein
MGSAYSKKEIRTLWKSMDKKSGEINLTNKIGGAFQQMTDAINRSKKEDMTTLDEYYKTGKYSTSSGDFYNCFETSIALNIGDNLIGNNQLEIGDVKIYNGNEFDDALTKGYNQVDQNGSSVAKTILRWADKNNTAQHASIYMGMDNEGNQYVFAKNGFFVQPGIFTTTYENNAHVAFKTELIYGTIKGITPLNNNNNPGGYYNKK